jgi:hypothetical protein
MADLRAAIGEGLLAPFASDFRAAYCGSGESG